MMPVGLKRGIGAGETRDEPEHTKTSAADVDSHLPGLALGGQRGGSVDSGAGAGGGGVVRGAGGGVCAADSRAV